MSELNQNIGTAIDFEIPSFYNTYTIDAFGGLKVAVYKSKSSRGYFYTPFILVLWNDFKESLDAFSEEERNNDRVIEISLVIQHSNNEIENNIISRIIEQENKISSIKIDRSEIALNILPFKFYKIFAKIGESKKWLNEDDVSNLSAEDSFTTQLSLIYERAYILKGTYKELAYFYNNRRTILIWANLYSDGTPYSTTSISAVSAFLNNSKNMRKLFGDEDFVNTNSITSSNSGGGFQFSIKLIGLGAGGGNSNSTVTTEKKQKRYLNRTVVSNVLNQSQSELNITIDGDIDRHAELIRMLVSKLFENKESIQAKIVQNDTRIDLMFDNQILYTLKSDESQQILNYKPNIEKKNDGETSFKYGGIEGSVKDGAEFKTQDDIHWEINKDGLPIPIKVDLYLLSETEFKDDYSTLAVLFNRETKKNTITPFLYPAVFLYKNPNYLKSNISDMDNPIGSILAFAGSRNNKPDGWEICDGQELLKSEFSELYNVINNIWGQASTEDYFKLPDLQGQFLRGVDYQGKVDPNVDERIPLGSGGIRDVGSFQDSMLKSHHHGLFGAATASTDLGGGSTANFLTSGGGGLLTKESEGSETRPKNVYVNYIIRTK